MQAFNHQTIQGDEDVGYQVEWSTIPELCPLICYKRMVYRFCFTTLLLTGTGKSTLTIHHTQSHFYNEKQFLLFTLCNVCNSILELFPHL